MRKIPEENYVHCIEIENNNLTLTFIMKTVLMHFKTFSFNAVKAKSYKKRGKVTVRL